MDILFAAIIAAILLGVAVFLALHLRSARGAAARAEARLRALTEASGFGVLVLDGTGRIDYANDSVAEMFGYEVGQLLGADKHQLLHAGGSDTEDGGVCPLREALLNALPFFGHEEFVHASGARVPVTVSSAPVADTGGGSALLIRDRSGELAERREREHSFAMISHELRSPLTTLVGFSHRLQRAMEDGEFQLPERRAEEVHLLANEATRMRDIIMVILDTAAVERPLQPEERPVDLALVAREEIERAAREHERAEFRTELGDEGAAVIVSDDRYIRRVIHNLLENAVKYGGDTPVDVSIGPEDDGFVLAVRDGGPGIPEDIRERIFDRFYRSETAAGTTPGLGLGLYLSRRLANGLGGWLGCESESGAGAEFRLWLPEQVTHGPGRRPDGRNW